MQVFGFASVVDKNNIGKTDLNQPFITVINFSSGSKEGSTTDIPDKSLIKSLPGSYENRLSDTECVRSGVFFYLKAIYLNY